jgi:hypothetical protein
MMSNDIEALQKIRDPAVRALAAAGSDTNVDVLVELDLPISRLYVESDPLGIRGRSFSVPDDPNIGQEGVFENFGHFLYDKSSREPTALRAAHAYATTLPARVLIEVARHPLVHSVVPNRQLVVG